MIRKLALALVLMFGLQMAHAQCSTTNPCVPVTVTQSPFVTGSTFTLYTCMGSATSCTSAALAALIATPGTQSVWRVFGPFPQKAAATSYNDPEPYGALMNYAASNTLSGGAASPVSAIAVFQVPAQTQTAPVVKVGTAIVTTGTAGPQ